MFSMQPGWISVGRCDILKGNTENEKDLFPVNSKRLISSLESIMITQSISALNQKGQSFK